MKNFFKKLLVILAILFTTSLAVPLNTPVYADSDGLGSCREFLPGMVSWDCEIFTTTDSEEKLEYNVKKIAQNIANSITSIASYLMIGYVIYGGYLYIFSTGDPSKAASGKKTLYHAFMGLAIIAFAKIIVSSIGLALLNNVGAFDSTNCAQNQCVKAYDLVFNIINWVIGIAGVVSAVYVVIGGIGYMTSAGDSGKLQKAKDTILYALIGLAIVGLSFIISNFAIDIINKADSGNDIREPIISLLNSIIGVISVVSVIFVVRGGYLYTTSLSDPGRIKKAKDTILYAVIGLIVCALAFAITNWAAGVINNNTSLINTKNIISANHDLPLPKKDIAFLEKKL